MSMALQVSVESGVLLVNATGKFSLEEAERTFVEMIGAVIQEEVAKVLFDGHERPPRLHESTEHAPP